MNIAVLSGKGGTGKTFVSVNLACAMKNSVYVDCDVEEPNGHLFFKPRGIKTEPVYVKLPQIDKAKCNGCRKCVEFCKFNALAFVKDTPILFGGVCHSCGGCKMVCPRKAISEKDYQIGEVRIGRHKNTSVISGVMNTGEESGVPIIRQLLGHINKIPTVIDCPPGSACSVMESVKNADYCIIVAEPTIFGRHNFEMVYELIKILKKPVGVVLNKITDDKNLMEDFCIKNDIAILKKIPYSSELAMDNAKGNIAYETSPMAKEIFDNLYQKVLEVVK